MSKEFPLQGKTFFQGLPISIENKKGSTRSGVDPHGAKWSIKMGMDYGYIRGGVLGADSEGLDVYIGPNRKAENAYIVRQHKIEMVTKWGGSNCPNCREHAHDCECPQYYDEDKIMLGFDSEADAKNAYLSQYDSELFLGPISAIPVKELKLSMSLIGIYKSPRKVSKTYLLDTLNISTKGVLDASLDKSPPPTMGVVSQNHPFISQPEKEPESSKGEPLPNPKQGILDSANEDRAADFQRAIMSAASIEEVEEIFLDAAELKFSSEEVEAVEYGMKAGQGRKAREQANEAVIAFLDSHDEKINITSEQRELLSKYTGQGGLDSNSVFEYYTPQYVAESTWDFMKINGFSGGSVGESSCGTGVFLGTKPESTKMVASELSSISSKCSKLLNPDDEVDNRPFEEVAAEMPDGSLDSFIGNVPFGDNRPFASKDPAYKKRTMSLDQYFVIRSIDKVRAGGLVTLILPNRIVDGAKHGGKKFRKEISDKAEFLGAIRLPTNTFKAGQNGTNTSVDVALFKKHPEGFTDQIRLSTAKALRESNVYFQEFIDGLWFKGSGQKHLLGAKKVGGSENFKRITYEFDGAEEDRQGAVQASLKTKFDSRIDWDAFGATAPEVPTYAEGDVQIISQVPHTLVNGRWVAEVSESDIFNLDAAKYGATTLDMALDKLKTPEGCLTLTVANVEAIKLAWPKEFRKYPRANDAYEFALAQKSGKNIIGWRGALTGQRIEKYQGVLTSGEGEAEDLGILQNSVMHEVETYGNPSTMRGIIKPKTLGTKDWINYSLAIDSKTGAFSDLMRGELDVGVEYAYDSGDIVSIIRNITGQTIKLDVEVSQIVNKYNGLERIENIHDVIKSDEVALTSDGTVMLLEQYMTGNIYKLISTLDYQISNEPDLLLKNKYIWQRSYIMKNRPYTELKEVEVRFTDKWLDRKYLEEFIDIAGYPFSYSEEKEMWEADSKVALFDAQFLKYLNRNKKWDEDKGKAVKSGKVKGGGKAGTAEYKGMISDLETEFTDFLREHENAGRIAEDYNSVFNANMPVTFSKAPLGLENLSGDIAPHGFQNSAVRQISADGKGFISLDVGLGKTFTALALIQYNIQNNLSKRTCITVPKSVLANWYHEAKSIHASIDHMLFIGITTVLDKDGNIKQEAVLDEEGKPKTKNEKPVMQDLIVEDSPDELRKKMHSIPHTNKKVVVMSSSRFGQIPLKAESLESYTNELVANEMMAAGTATDYLLSAAGYGDKERAAIVAKANSEKKEIKSYDDANKEDKWKELYSAKNATDKRSDYPYYEDMGFDSVIVDEAHDFKNIYTAQEEVGLKYLAATGKSNRGVDMSMKMNILKDNNNGRGPVMLTATPITNSPIEVFNALSLVTDMSELERMGVKTPDDFVRVFAKTGFVEVQKLSGEIETVEGVVGFKNLKALRNLFNRFAIVKTADDVDFSGGIKPPHAVEEHSAVSLNAEQEVAYEDLREELARTIRAMGGNETEEDNDLLAQGIEPFPVFSIMRQMEKATTDYDFYLKQMTWRFPAEHKALVAELISSKISLSLSGKRTDPESGVAVKTTVKRADPIVINTEGDLVTFVLPVEFEKEILTRLAIKKFDILSANVSHPVSGKYAKMLDNANKHIRADGKQIIFTEEKTEHKKLVRILLANTSLTEDQIGIINADSASSPEQVQVIADRFNSGGYKIVVCNKKAEVGVNLQKGTSAIHHLTLPWTPASIQQRNGRGVRQGNNRATVDVYYYIATGSLDINRLDALKAKANWIGQLMKSEDEIMENPNAGDDLLQGLMRDMMGEEAYEIKIASERAVKDAKAKAYTDKSALRTLKVMIKTATDLERLDSTVDVSARRRTRSIFPSNEKGVSGGKSLKQIESYLNDSPEDKFNERELNLMRTTLAELSQEKVDKQSSLNKTIQREKKKLLARDGLPFDSKILESLSEAIVLPNGSVVRIGSYINVVSHPDYKRAKGLARVVNYASNDDAGGSIFIEQVQGDYNPHKEIKGNKKDNDRGRVRLKLWPKEWLPITLTKEKEIEIEVAAHRGGLNSFLARWNKEDILAFASDSYTEDNAVYLIDGEYSLVPNNYYQKWDRLLWPDLNDIHTQNIVLGLAREKYGTTIHFSRMPEAKQVMLRYIGSDWEERYYGSFKLISLVDAEIEVAARFDALIKSLSDELLGDDVALYAWLEEDSVADSQYSNATLVYETYYDDLRAEKYDNVEDIESDLDRKKNRELAVYREKSRDVERVIKAKQDEIDRLEAEAIAADDRLAQEAKDAADLADRIKASESADKAFSEAGGSQLTAEQKGAFKRLGYDVEIITKQWEYKGYKAKNGRPVKGVTFDAGEYLKFEGGDLSKIAKNPAQTSITDRFSDYKNAKKYYYPRKMSIWEGHHGDEILLTPFRSIELDVEFYLNMLK
jgi:superfamily II DNA or RNA helicase